MGKAKKLAKCGTATVTSATCKVKNDGKDLILKNPAVTVRKDDEAPAELNPKQFAKQYAATYSPGAGPTANVTFAGPADAAYLDLGPWTWTLDLDGVGHKKLKSGKEKLKGKVDPSDRETLAALDPAAGPCVLEFRTPCEEPEPDAQACSKDAGGYQYCNTVGATCKDNGDLYFNSVQLWNRATQWIPKAGCHFSYSRDAPLYGLQDAFPDGWAYGSGSQKFDYLVSRCLGLDTCGATGLAIWIWS